MKIGVCLKWVPSTTAAIRIQADGKRLLLNGIEHILSSYDEFALEAALQLSEQAPGSTITALSIGGPDAANALTQAFAVGITEGVLIDASNADALSAARCAAAYFKAQAFDLILCGRQAIDDDQWVFAGALAELLDLPLVSAVSFLKLNDDRRAARCECVIEGATQVWEVELPAVISCNKGLNEPRSPTLKGRLNAKKLKPLVKTPADLGLGAEESSLGLTPLRFLPPAEKSPGKIVSTPPSEAAKALTQWLRNDARVL